MPCVKIFFKIRQSSCASSCIAVGIFALLGEDLTHEFVNDESKWFHFFMGSWLCSTCTVHVHVHVYCAQVA